VAALWAARGFETTHEDGVVRASRGDEHHRIRVGGVTGGRVDTVNATGGRADTVVAPAGASGAGQRVVDAERLAEMLYYAVDRTERDRLCERYLGAPPGRLRLPGRARVVRRLRRAARPVALAVVVVGLVGLVAGATALGGGDTTAVDEPVRSEGVSNAAGERADIDPVVPTGEQASTPYPPGVGPSGLTDPAALAAAHDRALANRSYTVWTDLYRPRGGQSGAPRVQRDMDIAVAADGRYLLETTVRGTDGDRGPPERTVYYDGGSWFVAERTGETTSYQRVPGVRGTPTVAPNPSVLRERLVSRYLSTPETTAVQTSQDGTAGTLLVGRGRPNGLDTRGLDNYTARAFVRPDGLVVNTTVTATVSASRPYTVRFEATYDRLGATRVDPPAWVAERFGTNATATPT
jgi:hypothetical protein